MVALLIVALVATTGLSVRAPAAVSAAPAGVLAASGWTLIKYPQGQPACTGVGYEGAIYFDRLDCGFGYVSVSNTTAASSVQVELIGSDGATLATQTTTYRAAENAWQFTMTPGASWPVGAVTIRVVSVDGLAGDFGETAFLLNQLGATVGVTGSNHRPGQPLNVTGSIYELDDIPPLAATQKRNVGATLRLRVARPDGSTSQLFGPYTANALTGAFSATIPGSATEGLTAGADQDFAVTIGIEVVDAAFTDTLTGAWGAALAGTAAVSLFVPPTGLVLQNSFVSSVGWVKPGDSYPSRVFVKNYETTVAAAVSVSIPAANGMGYTNAAAATGASGVCSVSGGAVSWTIPSIPAATSMGPGIVSCVLEARAKSTGQDPQIVWKDLSTTATLSYAGGTRSSTSHGPKVIPPATTYDTARYGDRPFPVVPVDFSDRSHDASHTGEALANKINSPNVPGSTFNLWQEISYGQLYPHGDVPSSAIATAGWTDYVPGFQFTTLAPAGTCRGVTYADIPGAVGSALLPERIRDGWYQLPGNTDYYGDDKTGTAIIGSAAGVGALQDIDSACGPTGKAVYDAAQIADPEIDYSDFDTDKDGVVDFFMMVFTGLGGNGASQLNVPSYDNIWPHSSSLEFTYTDADGQKGYVSDDQLKDLEGRPLFWTSADRTQMTTAATAYKVFVRVGPYNVNPESAIDNASVISHEYGHSLGLPDFYSTGTRETYGTWSLMGEDRSQHMDVFGKQELGWLVPRVLEPGQTVTVSNWQDSKLNTHRIDWVDPNGNPYTLSGPGVDNGEGYVAKLPSRQILDPAKVEAGASPTHVWWSQSGNDFGCAPTSGHNFDIYLPELASLPAGTPVSVTFKSLWNIEWDYDYGFVMASTDGGTSYQSLPSVAGYTTPAGQNPNANGCQTQYGNGLTGSSGSYAAGTQVADRVLSLYPDGGFLQDQYDLTPFAGQSTVLRFSYSTDPGLAKQGWFIDDLTVTAGGSVIYQSDFESGADDPRIFNGGCTESTAVAAQCTRGWQYVDASSGSPADHAYYLEMRDRSSFDLDGKGEDDRGNGPTWAGGLLLVYTDEAHGYGNFGTDDPPAQSPLDSQPEPGSATPNLDDAAFTAAAGKDTYSDFGTGHMDNYADPSSADGNWHFAYDCLSFRVDSMTGNGNGPATVPPYDLEGTVTFTMGTGCGTFDYGHGESATNAAPTAVAEARPTTADVGEIVAFDGSGSSDDRQAPSELAYEWDFGDETEAATGQSVTHAYEAAGTYTATLTVTDAEGLTSSDTIEITVGDGGGDADLRITAIEVVQNTGSGGQNGQPKAGDKVVVKATVTNAGEGDATASVTSFELDGQAMAGSPVGTSTVPAGESVVVQVTWDTRGLKDDHTIAVNADAAVAVEESDETNNTSTLDVSVKGNKVTNGDFSEPDSAGTGPEGWTGTDTEAGDATWTDQGTDGSKGATTAGNGGNAVLGGVPTWTSDPIAVVPGEALSLRVSVSSVDASSTASIGVAYLGAAGELLEVVPLIDVPSLTGGFAVLEQALTVPEGVTSLRIVLSGFSPTDLRTAGLVTFDDVGLYAE
jgi:M6 family metalloprotease-like protein